MILGRSPTQKLALVVTLLQGVLLMTWTLYALFLPAMAQRSGIPQHFVIWILIADQLIFMVCDWVSGVYADHLAVTTRKIGPLINLAAATSAALLAALPWLAGLDEPMWWLAALAVWAASSSFLRAPVFSMLGRIGGVSRKSGVVSWSLVGVCLAGALGPLLTTTLVKIDPALPLLIAAAALAASAWLASRAEPTGNPAPEHSTPPTGSLATALMLGSAVLLAAFGTQIHTLVVPLKVLGLTGSAAISWGIVFWSGFACGLIAASRLADQKHTHLWVALAVFGGAMAVCLVPQVAGLPAFVPLQLATGATWAIVFTLALKVALAHGRHSGLASPVGLIFSAMAAAAAARLTLTALEFDWSTWATPIAVASWLMCAGVLAVHPWTRVGHSLRR